MVKRIKDSKEMERENIERELSSLMERTLRLEDELNALVNINEED